MQTAADNRPAEAIATAPYDQLARLFDYPSEGFAARVRDSVDAIREVNSSAADELTPFVDFAQRSTLIEAQEVYTRSFDVQAITTLDIGYVLFGDDYKRGALLVNLNREEMEAGVDAGTELADHLPTVIRLIARLEEGELREQLVTRILSPALDKIIAEFTPERLDHRSKLYKKHYKTLIDRIGRNPLIYVHPLRAASMILRDLFPVEGNARQNDAAKSRGFIGSVREEILLEG